MIMAKKDETKTGLLTKEQKDNLLGLGEQVETATKRLALLKELGLGVSDLEDKLEWVKKRKDIFLEKGGSWMSLIF